MYVRMLGTGSTDGWPIPWCSCASCRAAVADSVVRTQTSALVDDRLLLDLGADGVRATLRLGVDLTAVKAVLVTQNRPEQHAWPAWMWRGWVLARLPLTLVAPAAVLAEAAGHLDPSVTTVQVAAGDRIQVAGYEVVALPAHQFGPSAGPAVLYDITGPDGARLLWATDTGPLSEQALALVQDRAYDAVLLDLTGTGQDGHHDLTSWPEQIAELRRRGAVVASTAVHAVHLGHHNPPPAELDRILADWGATALRDGERIQLGTGNGAAAGAALPRRVLVLGGTRSGKSAWAEQRLATEPAVTYVATAPARPDDPDWAARVHAHVIRRPTSWTTLESTDLAGLLATVAEPLLIDDLGLWLTQALDDSGGWDGPLDPVIRACNTLVAAWRARPTTVVLVAPEVGAGVVPSHASGRLFRDLLGELTARLARHSDEVVQVVAGLPRKLR